MSAEPAAGQTQLNGLEELLTRNQDLIAPKLNEDLQFVDGTADLAFLGLQRRQCGYVSGEAKDLNTLTQALRRTQISYSFAPIWFTPKEVEQAAFDVKDKTEQELRKKQEEDRTAREQEDLAKKREAEKQTQKGEVEKSLRGQNSVKARGLMNGINDLVRGLAEQRLRDIGGSFANYDKWLDARFSQGWETFNVKSEIADFGTVDWKGRPLDAIIVKTIIQQKNRVMGQYDDGCYIFGLVDDPEFQMQRDKVDIECSRAPVVTNWKVGEKFQSQWNAD